MFRPSGGGENALWLVALSAAGAVLAVVAAELGGASTWLRIVLGACGVVLGILVAHVRALRAQRSVTEAGIRAHVEGGSRGLLRISEVTLADARVHPAIAEDVAYVPRAAEAEVRATLREQGRVLIVGAAMSGKTRLALEVVRDLFPDHRLLKPTKGDGLRRLLALGQPSPGIVVWLDDLDRFIGTDGLSDADLKACLDNGWVVVASIRTDPYRLLRPTQKTKPVGGDVRNWFKEATVFLAWTDDDLERSAEHLGSKLLDAARRYGLPAYLGGGLDARDKYRAGAIESPIGHALVRAAADWRRLGVPSPVPRDVLVSALPGYLEAATRSSSVDDASLSKGFDWATELLNDTVSLLVETAAGYVVLDYVADLVAAENRKIPEDMWDRILASAPRTILVNVGVAADTRHGRADRAEALWERSGHQVGWYNLGLVRYDRGDERAAERWWRMSAEAGDPLAAYSLVVLLQRRGDEESLREAERWSALAAEGAGRSDFSKPRKPIGGGPVVPRFSGAPTAAQRAALTAAFRRYVAALESLGFALGELPTVHVEPGARAAYPEPKHDRLFVGEYVAHDAPSVLHEYSHWELEWASGVPRQSWSDDTRAIEAGLSYYLPCSALDAPITGLFDLSSAPPDYLVPYLDNAHLTGLQWAGAFWEVRDELGRAAIDPVLAAAWRAMDPTAEDQAAFVDRLLTLSEEPAVREAVRSALVRHALITA